MTRPTVRRCVVVEIFHSDCLFLAVNLRHLVTGLDSHIKQILELLRTRNEQPILLQSTPSPKTTVGITPPI